MLHDTLKYFLNKHKELSKVFSLNDKQDNFLISRIIELQQVLRPSDEFETLQFPNREKGALLLNEWEKKAELTIPEKDLDDIIDLSFFLMLPHDELIDLSRQHRKHNISRNKTLAKKIESVLNDKELLRWLKRCDLNVRLLEIFQGGEEGMIEQYSSTRASTYNIRPFLYGLWDVQLLMKDLEISEKHKKINLIELFKIFKFNDFHVIDMPIAINRINQYYDMISQRASFS
jgi:hypothetical protein